jgi:hypothetical protein
VLKLRAACGRISHDTLEFSLVKRANLPQEAFVLVRSGHGQQLTLLKEDGVQAIGMLTLACQAFKPNPVRQKQMVECPMHALEERADISPIVGVVKRKRGFI